MTAPIPVRVREEVVARSDPATEAAIYFCAIEAIQNAAKHAGHGTRVTVELTRGRGCINFEISDDGEGIEPDAPAEGMGLTSMRDRIGAVGGQLEVVSSPGAGTTVRGTVPDRPTEVTGGGPA